uniref:Uncharacterized protein n=1 Tax=Rhipicephalus zambeziensis TaxID=60191 RepID=A0A224YAJ7_9ACAR
MHYEIVSFHFLESYAYVHIKLYSHNGPNRDTTVDCVRRHCSSPVPSSVRTERCVKQQRPKSQLGSSGRNAEILLCSVNSAFSCECWLWSNQNLFDVTDHSLMDGSVT